MRKTALETLLLLSSIRDRKEIAEFCKEVRALEVEQIETLLTRFDEYKSRTLSNAAEVIEAELEQKRVRAAAEREKQQAIDGTSKEVLRLLLDRYKLKIPQAATQLSAELQQKGHQESMEGASSKANFTKWIKQLCEKVPKDIMMDATLNLRPKELGQ